MNNTNLKDLLYEYQKKRDFAELKARELKKEIIGTRVRILPLDLMEEESFERLKMVLAKEQPVVRILVNASGYGISGPFEHQTEEDAAGMIHLNCEALTRITYLVLPYLRRGSFIYQMASSAGFAPQPNFTVYAATKVSLLHCGRSCPIKGSG